LSTAVSLARPWSGLGEKTVQEDELKLQSVWRRITM